MDGSGYDGITNQGWSVNVPDLTQETLGILSRWAEGMLSGSYGLLEPDPYMPMKIVDVDGHVEASTVSALAQVKTSEECFCNSHSHDENDAESVVEPGSVVVASGGRKFELWANPQLAMLHSLPGLIRFTAAETSRTVYVWDFTKGFHKDVSVHLKLSDSYSSPDFLKGHAEKRPDGSYQMTGSDFLSSFRRGRLVASERALLLELLQRDWSWVNRFIKVTEWLEAFRRSLGL